MGSLSVVIKILFPVDCLSIYVCWNMKRMYIKSDFKAIFFKPATNGQSDKGFLLTSTFVPKGLSAPALGLYTSIKASKCIAEPGVRWAFTGPMVLLLLDYIEKFLIFLPWKVIKRCRSCYYTINEDVIPQKSNWHWHQLKLWQNAYSRVATYSEEMSCQAVAFLQT